MTRQIHTGTSFNQQLNTYNDVQFVTLTIDELIFNGNYTYNETHDWIKIGGYDSFDGFTIRTEGNFFGTFRDALVIEKTDANNIPVDGGIAFTMRSMDGTVSKVLTMLGDTSSKFWGNLDVAGDFTINGTLPLLGIPDPLTITSLEVDTLTVNNVIDILHITDLTVDDLIDTLSVGTLITNLISSTDIISTNIDTDTLDVQNIILDNGTVPSDIWDNDTGSHIMYNNYGLIGSMGAYGIGIAWNGYRKSGGTTWNLLNAASQGYTNVGSLRMDNSGLRCYMDTGVSNGFTPVEAIRLTFGKQLWLGTTTGTGKLHVKSSATNEVTSVVQMLSGQTANALEVQDGSGTPVIKLLVDKDGIIKPSGYKSSGGIAGTTQTVTFYASTSNGGPTTTQFTLQFRDGLKTAS